MSNLEYRVVYKACMFECLTISSVKELNVSHTFWEVLTDCPVKMLLYTFSL